MYHSCLLIDVGSNPDRPRPGRLWLRNLYRVHQRLCMAFPMPARAAADSQFLAPFVPKDFLDLEEERSDVKVRRTEEQSFLFRVDLLSGNRAVILVQSAREPDWNYAFHNADYFLAAPPCVKPAVLDFVQDQRLRFRLLANPVRQASRNSLGFDGKPLNPKWLPECREDGTTTRGRDVPVPNADLDKWLLRRAEPGWSAPSNDNSQCPPGFKVESIATVQPGYVLVSKGRDDDRAGGKKRRSALYNGILEVTNSEHFKTTLIKGIGPAKAFGFGLLSVAPVLE